MGGNWGETTAAGQGERGTLTSARGSDGVICGVGERPPP